MERSSPPGRSAYQVFVCVFLVRSITVSCGGMLCRVGCIVCASNLPFILVIFSDDDALDDLFRSRALPRQKSRWRDMPHLPLDWKCLGSNAKRNESEVHLSCRNMPISREIGSWFPIQLQETQRSYYLQWSPWRSSTLTLWSSNGYGVRNGGRGETKEIQVKLEKEILVHIMLEWIDLTANGHWMDSPYMPSLLILSWIGCYYLDQLIFH